MRLKLNVRFDKKTLSNSQLKKLAVAELTKKLCFKHALVPEMIEIEPNFCTRLGEIVKNVNQNLNQQVKNKTLNKKK